MKRKTSFFLTALLLVCILGTTVRASADFGDYSDYSSDWGSDLDFDFDYDYDWSGSYDYDFDYGFGFSGFFSTFITAVIFIIIVVVVIAIKATSRGRTAGTTVPRQSAAVPAHRLPDNTDSITLKIQESDPAFSSYDFITYTKHVFIEIQNAWSKQDLTPVAGIMHQNLYQMTDRQLAQQKEAGIINRIERISVPTAYLTEFSTDERFEFLTVYACAQMIDYQERMETGQLIRGNKNVRLTNHYRMKFQRTRGTKTFNSEEKLYDLSLHCPNCGAPVTGTAFGICEYCDSTVTNNQYTWVLTEVSPVR